MFYEYARQIFPRLSDLLDVYGTWKWYQLHYGMDAQGRLQQWAATSDEEDKVKDGEEQGCQTRFESKRKLQSFMGQVALGRHDHWRTLSANNSDLGCEGMKNVQKVVSEIWALYKTDFPDTSASNSALPSTELQMLVLGFGEIRPGTRKGI